MNKAELIDAVAARFALSKREVTEIVEAFLDETKKAVVRGEKVAVSGFGVFESQARKARLGRNPRTGETVKIKATKLPKFRPGAEFKAVVSGAKKIIAKAPVKKAAPARKAAPVKKAAPVRKAAPVKKAAPVRKAAPVKKAAPVRKAAPVKKAAPVRKAAPVKKAVPAKKAPAKKAVAKK